MSPSPSSNSTRRESQKLVEPSFTRKAMFLPPRPNAAPLRSKWVRPPPQTPPGHSSVTMTVTARREQMPWSRQRTL
nr:unnamed protein product [Digitaria exilis]